MTLELKTAGSNTVAETSATLRVLVGALGELADPPWWRTRYLSETGLRFLERIYPHTAFAAAVGATTIAARAVHDESIGRGSVSHLFRLPQSFERGAESELAGEFGRRLFDEVRSELGDSARLLERLQRLASEAPKVKPGPLRLDQGGPTQPEGYGRLAGAYLQAFGRNERVFPYWEAPKEQQ